MIVYRILESGYFGGTEEYPDGSGIPFGTTRTSVPVIPDGYYAKWTGSEWSLTTASPINPSEYVMNTQPVTDVQSVTMRQARKILFKYGYIDAINNFIENLPSPDKELAQIDWEYATEVSKNSTLTLTIASYLQLAQSTIDKLFYEASLIGD